jgi:5-methylcytosine-specific restriction endonuclease McrA
MTKLDWHARVYKQNKPKNMDKWKLIREAVLVRDNLTCYRCERTDNLTVHHLVPRAEGGGDSLRNLITLCSKCHDYAEVEQLRTRIAILASSDLPNKEAEAREKLKPKIEVRIESFVRPEWHKYVYGGVRRHDELSGG